MATRFIDKARGAESTATSSVAITDTESNRRLLPDLPDAASFVYDTVDNVFKYNRSGVITAIADGSGTFTSSPSGNGTANGATVSATETINGNLHKTTLTLASTPVAIADATPFTGTKIYDFPAGIISIEGAYASLAETTTSTLASTLNANAVLGTALGSTAAAANPMTTTAINMLGIFNVTASATINVAGATASSAGPASKPTLDGTSTAVDAYLNVQVTTDTEIDADATTTWSGTIVIYWRNLGDF